MKMKKAKVIFFILLVVAIALALFLYFAYSSTYIGNKGFLKGNYSLASSYCMKPAPLSSIGIEKMCMQTYVLKVAYNYLTPTVVFTFYKFNSSASAEKFLNGVSGYLNSTPWPSGIVTNLTKIGNYTYTTEQIPNYYVRVYTLYYMNDSKVISLSILNSTSKNSSYMLPRVVSLMDSIRSKISNMN
ncbi:MAG: hypothetical protein ACP5P2_02845 [Candidatus Micrarchaeia archaeon]